MDLKALQSNACQLLLGGNQTTYDTMKDGIEVMRDILGIFGDASTAGKIVQKIITLPDKLYMRKYHRFAEGLLEYNSSEDRHFLQKVSKLEVEKQIPFILNVINACEEEEKMDFLVKLTEAWMEKNLEDASYHRLTLMMERTPYDDLTYLEKLFEKQQIELRSVEDESLLANGWLTADGVALQRIHREAATRCHLTANAWKFGEIIFGMKLEGAPDPFRPFFIIEEQED